MQSSDEARLKPQGILTLSPKDTSQAHPAERCCPPFSLQWKWLVFRVPGSSKMGFPRFSRGSCCLLSRLPPKLGSPETRSRPRGFLLLYSRHFSAWGERWFARMPQAVSTRREDVSRCGREMGGEKMRKRKDRERESTLVRSSAAFMLAHLHRGR